MSITNIDKNHLNSLLLSLNKDDNYLEIIKSNHANYAKLKLIDKQMKMLKNEALEIINDIDFQQKLQNIKTKIKLVSGTNYYLYKNSKDELFFSIISNEEWINNKCEFMGKYYYDFDKQFISI